MKMNFAGAARVAAPLFVAGALAGCGMKPGLYAMPDTVSLPLDSISILSGTENYRTGKDEGQLVRFTAVNGKALPRQRGGGGVQSLALKPGTYRIKALWVIPVATADLFSTPEFDFVAKPNCKYKFTVSKDEKIAYKGNFGWTGAPTGPQGNQDCAG